jgi:hypothetical protein
MEDIKTQQQKLPIDRVAEENIYQELKAQYDSAKQTGYGYRHESDLDTIFRRQAGILAAGGLKSVYEIGTQPVERSSVIEVGSRRPDYQFTEPSSTIQNVYKLGDDYYYESGDSEGAPDRIKIDPARIIDVQEDVRKSYDAETGNESVYSAGLKIQVKDDPRVELINKRTNAPVNDIELHNEWREDPLAYNLLNKPIEVETNPYRGFNRTHTNYGVKGAADLSFQMVPDAQGNQVPLILPVYRSTSTDLTPLIIAGTLLAGGLYFGPGATAGAAGSGATAGTAAAGTGATAGTAAGTAAGTGLTVGAGGVTGLTAGAASTGIGAGAIGTGIVAPAGFTLAPTLGTSLAAGGAGIGLLDSTLTSSIGETGLLPGATEGFQASAIPSASGMGGAQGLTVPVAGGTVTASGFIPAGATIPLGGGKELSLLDTARGLNTLKNLTFKPPQPGQQPMSRPQSQFSLPAAQPTVVGLLPLAERYRRSLL